jgi:PAS domain S-box-containing protein
MRNLRDQRYAELIFNHIPMGVFTVNEHGLIDSFNRAAEQITGWRRDEVTGRPCREVFRSNHCTGRCFLQDSIVAGEEHRDEEVKISCRDGSELLVSISTAALRDDGGKVIGGIEMFRDRTEIDTLRRELKGSYTFSDIVSKSAAMRDVRELIPLVAKSESTVLIEGEPGTGKELVARAIHNLGPRRKKPFVAVNCGALPDTLVESELFGHARGAFTDAKRDRLGRFAQAAGGTLLLDEIGDISSAAQVKLLRVLQEKEFVPLGSDTPVKSDVRVLAATNRDLTHEAMNGRFRQDLFFRLNVVRVVLPPLRARWEDIPLLIEHFIARFNTRQGRRITGLSERARDALVSYPYPGNVRELENAVEHAFVMCAANTIQIEDLPMHIRGGSVLSEDVIRQPEHTRLESAEAAAIRETLEQCGGSRTRAAEALGISRNTLWRKMKKHRIS